jgi:hypothetical protein
MSLFRVRMNPLVHGRAIVLEICLEDLRRGFEEVHVKLSLFLFVLLSHQDGGLGLLFEGRWYFRHGSGLILSRGNIAVAFTTCIWFASCRFIFFFLLLATLPFFRLAIRATAIFITNFKQKGTITQLINRAFLQHSQLFHSLRMVLIRFIKICADSFT